MMTLKSSLSLMTHHKRINVSSLIFPVLGHFSPDIKIKFRFSFFRSACLLHQMILDHGYCESLALKVFAVAFNFGHFEAAVIQQSQHL